MARPLKIAFVGGGSMGWAPKIIRDIMVKRELPDMEVVLLDPNLNRAVKIKQLADKMNGELRTNHRFVVTDRQEEAFDGCDYVLVCISTGGLKAMRHDIEIPEKYGIYQTVGDTVGPGGWSRNLRNIPVFNRMAKDIERLSSDAVVLNYTNPMACLTKAFYAQTKLRAVGLCHGLFETYEVLMDIFGLASEEDIKLRVGGVNHFFWINELRIQGKDGYQLLREKLGKDKRLEDLLSKVHEDLAGFNSSKLLAGELFATYGYLTYTGDRHTCEFIPNVVKSESELQRFRIRRTSIDARVEGMLSDERRVDRLNAGEESVHYTKSRETAADIIEALALGREFVDVVNVPNIGQIPNLPLGGIVETLGVINTIGFTPICAGPLPEPIRRLVQPHLDNSETIYRAATEGDIQLALEALYNEPSCSHLSYKTIHLMAMELLQANRELLPFINGQ